MAGQKLCFIILVALAVIEGKRFNDKRSSTHKAKKQVVCEIDEFPCANGHDCIHNMYHCDEINDCLDGSDEINCPAHCTGENEFRCTNGKCISKNFVCDTDNDCGDMSDEVDCHLKECKDNEVKCDNHLCILATWVCDGDNDCRNNWDEKNCIHSCPAEQFLCLDGSKCIPEAWRCDGGYDCYDRTDETACVCNETTHFRCAEGRCINKLWRCDRENDCGDASDELGCPTLHHTICMDYLNIRDCALLNETSHPICLNDEDGYKYCRQYCHMCLDDIRTVQLP